MGAGTSRHEIEALAAFRLQRGANPLMSAGMRRKDRPERLPPDLAVSFVSFRASVARHADR